MIESKANFTSMGMQILLIECSKFGLDLLFLPLRGKMGNEPDEETPLPNSRYPGKLVFESEGETLTATFNGEVLNIEHNGLIITRSKW